jgi:hypothetical protein
MIVLKIIKIFSQKDIFIHLSWVHLVVKGGEDLNHEVDMY